MNSVIVVDKIDSNDDLVNEAFSINSDEEPLTQFDEEITLEIDPDKINNLELFLDKENN